MWYLMTVVAAIVFFVVVFGWWGILGAFLYWALLVVGLAGTS